MQEQLLLMQEQNSRPVSNAASMDDLLRNWWSLSFFSIIWLFFSIFRSFFVKQMFDNLSMVLKYVTKWYFLYFGRNLYILFPSQEQAFFPTLSILLFCVQFCSKFYFFSSFKFDFFLFSSLLSHEFLAITFFFLLYSAFHGVSSKILST